MRHSQFRRNDREPTRKPGHPPPRTTKGLVLSLVATRAAKLRPGAPPRGFLRAGSATLPCALGAGGIVGAKREGDGASPAGRWRLLFGFFRPDRLARPQTALPIRAARRRDGWCDDPPAAAYNRPVRLPFPASCEEMWRSDGLYDLVIALDYNMEPRRSGRGSAIFLHCAREGYAPTQGCVALARDDLRRLLPRLSSRTVLTIR